MSSLLCNASEDCTSRRPNLESTGVGLVALILFTLGIGNHEFVDFNVRFAVFAQEMLRHGPSLFPTTYGEPYPDYPGLSTFIIWCFAHIFHRLNTFVVQLPTAIASATTLALTYRLLCNISVRWAVMAVCLELLTAKFWVEARSISIDQMITTLTLACFFLVWQTQHRQHNQHQNEQRHGHEKTPLSALLTLLFTGFCLRGPMGIVIPSGVICGIYAVDQRWRQLSRFGLSAALLFILCLGGLYLLSRASGGEEFARNVLWMQVLGRISGMSGAPFYYYFTHSFGSYALSFLPAIAVILALLLRSFKGKHATYANQWSIKLRLCTYMAAWVAIILVGLSVPESKKSRYLLPLVPALAVLASYPFEAPLTEKVLLYVKKFLRYILLYLPLLLLSVLIYGRNLLTERSLVAFQNSFPDIFPGTNGLILLLAGFQVLSFIVLRSRRQESTRDILVAVIAIVAVYSVQITFYEPFIRDKHTSHAFVQAVEHIREQQPAPLVLFAMGRDNLGLIYLVNADKDLQPVFMDSVADFNAMQRPFYLIVGDSHVDTLTSLPPPVLAGKFRGKPYALYYFH